MKEEFITKGIIQFLESNGWNIFSFDFPQSGTGLLLHPNERTEKNKDSVIPDIIANKDDFCIIMENKPYFYENDFLKLNKLKTTSVYENDLEMILSRVNASKIRYGIGIPNEQKIIDKSLEYSLLIDFLITIDLKKSCKIYKFTSKK